LLACLSSFSFSIAGAVGVFCFQIRKVEVAPL
jgi:hypothetical protein